MEEKEKAAKGANRIESLLPHFNNLFSKSISNSPSHNSAQGANIESKHMTGKGLVTT